MARALLIGRYRQFVCSIVILLVRTKYALLTYELLFAIGLCLLCIDLAGLDAKKRSVIIMDLMNFVGCLFFGGLIAGVFWMMATWFETLGYWRRAAFASLTFMVPAGLFAVIVIAMHGFYLLRHFIPHGNACV